MSAPQLARRNGGLGRPSDAASSFFLYVEGPRDEGILRLWLRRMSPPPARHLESRVVILGGRRPARAQTHFRSQGGGASGARGLVVLDRDHRSESGSSWPVETGLEIFTWRRRHIESYALVPAAIRRSLRSRVEPRLLERLIEDYLPPLDDEEACAAANAKKILGSKGEFARSAGGRFSPEAVARCMRVEDFHPDIFALYDRIRSATGFEQSLAVRETRGAEFG